MSSRRPTEKDATLDGDPDADLDLLRVRNALLSEELDRLRGEYVRAKQAQYRRTALGFLVVGLLATGGGLAFAPARTVLFALGGTGLFVGLLAYYLTPERFVAASVGAGVYSALASTEESIAAELGLADVQVYVPTGREANPVRLYVPQQRDYTLPTADELRAVFVTPEETRQRGVSFVPTGGALFEEFTRVLVDDLHATPAELAEQLTDGLVEQFELADAVTWERAGESSLVFGVAGTAYGQVQRIDHPIQSFLAVGLARGLDRPIRVETTASDDGRVDFLVTCRWDDS